VSGQNPFAIVLCDIFSFLSLALISQGEANNKKGNVVNPLISAFYLIGMAYLINFILSCFEFVFWGEIPPPYSFWIYFAETIEALILLLWALFYYRLARNMATRMPFPFSILTILSPLVSGLVIAASIHRFNTLEDSHTDVFLYGGMFGTLIIILNMCLFYFYTKLSVTYEALVFANKLANTPPVWTKEEGLSAAFIDKYEITQREKEVIEIMLTGKTDKEIAITLNIAVNTVQTHLKRIYQKTGSAGRFALSALIRGK
jgi:DNA-binding CsgD family transcriptional regulator